MTPARLAAICAARVFLFATFMTVAAVIPLLMQEWQLTATAAGAGLGLFVSRRLVEAHGGTLTLRSSPAGSTFAVHLPRRAAEQPLG